MKSLIRSKVFCYITTFLMTFDLPERADLQNGVNSKNNNNNTFNYNITIIVVVRRILKGLKKKMLIEDLDYKLNVSNHL